MKSGLEGRNKHVHGFKLVRERVSMKSGLEGRNKLVWWAFTSHDKLSQ